MPKPPKLSLKSIVAATAAPAAQEAKVVPFRGDPAARAGGRGTLKERSKQLSVYLDPAVYDQLRDIAYTERTKIHPLMLEALDLLFSHRGARSIRELESGSTKPG
jgi:antitoxin-like ribbon-helix-helix protein